jgi:hypothetical protein
MDVCSRRMSAQPATTRVDARVLGLSVLFLLLVTAAGLLYLSQASTVAELRYRLSESEWRRASLQEDIAHLRCQIASSQSLAGMEERWQRLGLVPAQPDDLVVVVCSVPALQAGSSAGGVVGLGLASAPRSHLDRLRSLLVARPSSP